MAGEKSMALALIISFIFTGLGIAYAGDATKGILIFVISVILNILAWYVMLLFAFVNIIVWAVGMYLTYKQVKIANGQA